LTAVGGVQVVDGDWKKHGLNSEVFVAFNVEKRVAIIGGTWYGGEMKKGECLSSKLGSLVRIRVGVSLVDPDRDGVM
jgi:ATP-dependent phosphoenolpyruvate carboxykinase